MFPESPETLCGLILLMRLNKTSEYILTMLDDECRDNTNLIL